MCKPTPTTRLADAITRLLATAHDERQRREAIICIAQTVTAYARHTPRALQTVSDLEMITGCIETVAEFSEKYTRQQWESAVWKLIEGWPVPTQDDLDNWFGDCVKPEEVPDLWSDILNDSGE